MVALVQRVRKLEEQVAERSQTAHLDDRVVYQPSKEELAEAVAILVGCGAAREVARTVTCNLGPAESLMR